jgi:hypothetical protein
MVNNGKKVWGSSKEPTMFEAGGEAIRGHGQDTWLCTHVEIEENERDSLNSSAAAQYMLVPA